jgi:hypothetical protein
MPNINDAEITAVYVSQTVPGGVQDDAPNAPVGGGVIPGAQFDVTLEMVAGSALFSQEYTLTVGCANVTDTTDASALVPVFPPPPASTVGAAPWKPEGSYYTYTDNQTVNVPAGYGGGQVYRYTASLITANGEVASIKQSEPFVLY